MSLKLEAGQPVFFEHTTQGWALGEVVADSDGAEKALIAYVGRGAHKEGRIEALLFSVPPASAVVSCRARADPGLAASLCTGISMSESGARSLRCPLPASTR